MALDSWHFGCVVRETYDKIVIFGDYKRFDVPKSGIKEVGRNVIFEYGLFRISKYKVDK